MIIDLEGLLCTPNNILSYVCLRHWLIIKIKRITIWFCVYKLNSRKTSSLPRQIESMNDLLVFQLLRNLHELSWHLWMAKTLLDQLTLILSSIVLFFVIEFILFAQVLTLNFGFLKQGWKLDKMLSSKCYLHPCQTMTITILFATEWNSLLPLSRDLWSFTFRVFNRHFSR